MNFTSQLLENSKTFKDNIWGADLADTQLINKYNKGIQIY